MSGNTHNHHHPQQVMVHMWKESVPPETLFDKPMTFYFYL